MTHHFSDSTYTKILHYKLQKDSVCLGAILSDCNILSGISDTLSTPLHKFPSNCISSFIHQKKYQDEEAPQTSTTGPTPWTIPHVKTKKNNLEQDHPSTVKCFSEYSSSWASQAGQVAFHWAQLLIYKIRMKLLCSPHQSRQSLLEYWWPANGLLPQLPSLDTPTEQKEREGASCWIWAGNIDRLSGLEIGSPNVPLFFLPFHTFLLRAAYQFFLHCFLRLLLHSP